MPKINLNSIVSGFNLSKINDNFTKIADALNNKVLYRDNPVGENNSVNTDVDMNGRRLYNLPTPVQDSEPMRLQDIKNIILGNNLGATPSLINQSTVIATEGQTVVATPLYTVGSKSLEVFKNGKRLLPVTEYVETTTTSITLITPAGAGDVIFIRTFQFIAFGGVDAADVSASDGAGGSLFSTVAGFISKILSSAGSSFIKFFQNGTGAITRDVQTELRDSVKVTQFGASPSNSDVTNSSAFVAATNFAIANGLNTILIPSGVYNLKDNWVLSTSGIRVEAIGKVVLNFTGAGNCVTVDGGSLYTFDVHFGTKENPIFINGNSLSTTGLLWKASHHGSASVKIWNCVIGHRTQFAVCNDFYITVSNSEALSNILVPTTGISCERRNSGEDTAANTWWNPIIEGVKTSTGHGIYLGYTNRNKFIGGTSEGNNIGVFASSTSVGDNIDGIYCEVNSGAAHFDISGTLITLTDCQSTTSSPAPTDWVRIRSGATDCRVIGGNHPSITIDSGAIRTQVIGNAHSTSNTVVDNGTNTTIIQGGSAGKLPFGSYIGGGAAPLAYYSEGVINATITCGSGTVALDPSFKTLGWVRVGRLVTVTGLLIVSSVSSPTGLCMLGNLPFFPDTLSSSRAAISIRGASLAAGATSSLQGRIISSDNKVYLEYYTAGAANNLSPYLQANTELYLTISYIAS